MATAINCPVCDNPVPGNVCEQCGWMRLVFPAKAPASLKSLNSEYTETMKRVYKTRPEVEKRNKELELFISRLAVSKQGVKFVFQQDLFRENDNVLCFRSTVDLVVMDHGKLVRESAYDELLL